MIDNLKKSFAIESISALFTFILFSPFTNRQMPHALAVPSPGFQALILCGPGASLNTFTSKPEEFPKALVPIANRPMIWYPLDWCYRMGITSMYLLLDYIDRYFIELPIKHEISGQIEFHEKVTTVSFMYECAQ